MARRKTEETITEKLAEMKSGREKKTVKAWQYYSIVDFCRGCGETQSLSDEIARWCDRKAKGGEFYEGNGYTIRIIERTVKIA